MLEQFKKKIGNNEFVLTQFTATEAYDLASKFEIYSIAVGTDLLKTKTAQEFHKEICAMSMFFKESMLEKMLKKVFCANKNKMLDSTNNIDAVFSLKEIKDIKELLYFSFESNGFRDFLEPSAEEI